MICRRPAEPLAGLALLALAGCATPTHLIFHQSTVLGVDVSTSADNSSVHVKVGYDRQTGTIIPKSKVKTQDGTKEEFEAMSAVSRSRIKVEFFRPSEICERFATGEAARNVARQGAIHALRGEGTSSGTGVCEGF